MIITRIQVEAGFLNGFDLKLVNGLNVLIGARGTGKTSVIELIRYALAAKNHTPESKIKSLSHARAILEGGEVVVTLADGPDEITVSRGADDESPASTSAFLPPIVLSQTEIETLGLSESGRLSLLDGFIATRATMHADEASMISSIKSTYKEIQSLILEISSVGEGVDKINSLNSQLDELVKQQASLQSGIKGSEQNQIAFNEVSKKISALSVNEQILQRFINSTESWEDNLKSLLSGDFSLDSWDDHSFEDPLKDLREKYLTKVLAIENLTNDFRDLRSSAISKFDNVKKDLTDLEKQSRSLRSDIDKVVEGSGAIARQITQLNTQIAQLKSREKLLTERKLKMKSIQKIRDERFADLEKIRSERFKLRIEAAKKINENLNPTVKINVEQAALYGDYTNAIANALRGSGLKYSELSVTMSELVSPRELIELTETENFESFADIISIPKERAARVLGYLKEYGLGEIVTSSIEDGVRMQLLDGTQYKDISELSAGQRCTVILSIVLQHKERTLVIDQPEDHLDNAFITQTVIVSLLDRKQSGQVILSTHNANIPVLGQADLVNELTSDGKNGFLQLSKPLDDYEAVEAITNVMEGGREAFLKRSKFYDEHDLL